MLLFVAKVDIYNFNKTLTLVLLTKQILKIQGKEFGAKVERVHQVKRKIKTKWLYGYECFM